ncbi:CheY chemotaxis protein or a CheY-like REC (receiver) domain [Enhydrobacter aerosaccus]|uniref:CheY chemotaxis protein or a CheY-like REC (Receiver) domain n=1 Tax=Enhydrobacter aerosaccus TaxID=225324 RepID=A0A1T4NWD7_9HYPH|nr:response regulator [Enhydrobacter aerosaccus]SJZ83362.1 CheY chemotaxis protein or a CheY-like REC (receiver) domain [Enhydrobacter aerosaccus]
MPVPGRELEGLKILVVEDNFLVAEYLRDMLEDHGCEVVGPAPRVRLALDLLQGESKLDAAILDINLNGEFCFPIATALRAASIPFLFLTGYDDDTIVPADFKSTRHLPKPVERTQLLEAILEIHGQPGS